MLEWFANHEALLAWVGVISLLTLVGSFLALPWLVSLIPENYFIQDNRKPAPWKKQHPLFRLLLLTLKNLLGLILICGGLLMLFLPGQGLLTLAMGLLLLDYPGKFRLERRIVAIPVILKGLNWLRAKRRCPPLRTE